MPHLDLPSHLSEVVPLGRGAFGQVYRATAPDGRLLAVKVLSPEAASRPEAAWQFTSEYRRLARLSHPAFPAAVEEGVTPGGSAYYAMAFVPGKSLPADRPHDAAEVRRLLVQLAEALSYLHGQGQIHGDLKPDNLLVDPAGRLHLIDVGLMVPVGQKREGITGTLEYLAPEALRKSPAAPSEDLYAAGAIAHQLLTGRPPFSGGVAELIRAHLQSPPPAPSGYPGPADAELERLVVSLLAKDPAARPASAWAVLAALGEPVDEAALAAGAAGLRGGAFVGRAEVLDRWREVLASGQDDPWLGLVGPLGSGKSRTLEELRLIAQLEGRGWIGAACLSGGAAGAPVRSLVRQALTLAGLTPDPLLADWLAGQTPAAVAELEPTSAKALLYNAAADALEAAARAVGGLAAGFDDADSADGASREFLQLLRRRPAAPDLAWALTFTETPAEALLPGTSLAPLAPLAPEAIADLLEARLGAAPPETLVALIATPAQGSPLLADLMLEHLVASGQLRRREDGWAFDAAKGAGKVPEGLAAIWQARLAALDADARRLAVAVAVGSAAGGVPAPLLGAVVGLAPEALEAASGALRASGLVTEADGRLKLAVADGAASIMDAVSSSERAGWATALARATLGPDREGPAPLDVLTRAARLADAGDDPALAFRLLGEAGRRTLALAAPGEALQLLTAAQAHMPAEIGPEARLGLLFARAEAARFVDQTAAAAEDYTRALEAAAAMDDRASEARILNGLAKCRQLLGDYEAALAALEQASRAAEAAADPAQAVRAAVSEGRLRLYRGQADLAMAAGERAVGLARRADAPALLAQALNLQGVLLSHHDPHHVPEAVAMLQEAFAISRQSGDRLGMAFALDNLGNAHLAVGDLLGAFEAFSEGARVCREAGAETEALSADLNLAIVAGERGASAQARRLAAEVIRRATAVGRRFPVAVVKAVEGQAAWRAGQPARSLAPFEEAIAIAIDLKNKLLEEHVRMYRLEALLALGDWDEAEAEVGRVAPLVEASGSADMGARLACHRAALGIGRGEPGAAGATLAPIAEGTHQLAAHRAHQLLAEARLAEGRPSAALPHARAALALAEAWEAPWHRAHDAWLVARAAHAAGDAAEAIAAARSALTEAGPESNLYAHIGAGLVLQAAGALQEGRAAADAAMRTLETAELTPEARQALFAAWNLQAEAAPAPAVGGLAIDPIAYAGHVEAIASALDEAAIGRAVLSGLVEMVGAERGYLLSYEGGRLTHAITQDMDYDQEVEVGFSTTIANQALFSSEPIYVQDASADADWQQAKSVMALGLRTVVAIPLATPETILGVLYMDREAIEPLLGPADLALLGALATTAAVAIEAARLKRRAEVEHQRAEQVLALARALVETSDPAGRREALLSHCLRSTGAERALWLVRSAEADTWRPLAQVGPVESALSQGIASWVAEQGEPVGILDTSANENWQARQSVQAMGLRTIWCVPVPGTAHAVVYLDAGTVVPEDPQPALRRLEGLVGFAAPLLGP